MLWAELATRPVAIAPCVRAERHSRGVSVLSFFVKGDYVYAALCLNKHDDVYV